MARIPGKIGDKMWKQNVEQIEQKSNEEHADETCIGPRHIVDEVVVGFSPFRLQHFHSLSQLTTMPRLNKH